MSTTEGPDPAVARRIGLGALGLLVLGVLAFGLLRRPPGPPPPEIAGDPLLVEGRAVYLMRCVSCHGASGKGDGPIAKGVGPPPPGDLTDDVWKHGDRPEQVAEVIALGVPGTGMSAWKNALSPQERRAVAAYVYHLARRPVPELLRAQAVGSSR